MYQDYDLDEYEDDGEVQEDEEAEEEYEEEQQEDPQKAEEEAKELRQYLSLRQKLKESARRRLNGENGTSSSNSQERQRRRLPNDNFGSFFGPSQHVIAPRVIQESKSLLENQHLAARVSNASHKSTSVSSNSQTKPGVREPTPKVVNQAKLKAQKLKELRDYSSLLSGDAELPSPKKEQPAKNVSAPKSAARPPQVPSKSKPSMSNLSKSVSNGRDQRRFAPTNRPMQSKAANHHVPSGSKMHIMNSNDPRKQLGRNAGNGPGRPVGSNGFTKMPAPTKVPMQKKTPASTMDKKVSLVGAKKPVPGIQKAPLPKLHSSMHKQQLEQRREFRVPDKAKLNSKMPVSSSKPQMKPPKQIPPRPMQPALPKKRTAGPFDEDDEADPSAIIRKMFNYNPKRYGSDEDDSDMEAGFDDILEEEKISARIAREEDERELRLIEEEERQEKLRREAKKRRISQR